VPRAEGGNLAESVCASSCAAADCHAALTASQRVKRYTPIGMATACGQPACTGCIPRDVLYHKLQRGLAPACRVCQKLGSTRNFKAPLVMTDQVVQRWTAENSLTDQSVLQSRGDSSMRRCRGDLANDTSRSSSRYSRMNCRHSKKQTSPKVTVPISPKLSEISSRQS
jgi:hypothetical protein